MKGFLSGQRRVLLTPLPSHLTSTLAILRAPSLQALRRAKLQQSDLLPAVSRDGDGGMVEREKVGRNKGEMESDEADEGEEQERWRF